MSAYMVEPHHIAYLVAAAFDCPRQPDTPFFAGKLPKRGNPRVALAKMLEAENAKSVEYRYPRNGKVALTRWKVDALQASNWNALLHFDPIQIVKAVHCYQYQACEHPDWQTSVAKEITDWILDNAIRALPGYEQAYWGAPEPLKLVVV